MKNIFKALVVGIYFANLSILCFAWTNTVKFQAIFTGTINTPSPAPDWVDPDAPIPTIITVGGDNYPGTITNWNDDGQQYSNINIQLPPGVILIAPITMTTTTVQGGLICTITRSVTEDPDNEGRFIITNGAINCVAVPGRPPMADPD